MERVLVEKFLVQFKEKVRVFGLEFRIERKKNFQGLLDLDITARERERIVLSLTVEDYYKGPSANTSEEGALWEFGKSIKKKETYIKLAEGAKSQHAVCVSFHPAERKIHYPFKQSHETGKS